MKLRCRPGMLVCPGPAPLVAALPHSSCARCCRPLCLLPCFLPPDVVGGSDDSGAEEEEGDAGEHAAEEDFEGVGG